MKSFTRIVTALGLAAVFSVTAAFAQMSAAPAKTKVKGYTKMTKTGQMVHVKAYTRKVTLKKGMKPGRTM